MGTTIFMLVSGCLLFPFSFFLILALPMACGSCQARDQTYAAAVTQDSALITQILTPALPGNSSAAFLIKQQS